MITGIYAIKDAKSTFMPCTVDVNDASRCCLHMSRTYAVFQDKMFSRRPP